MEITTVGFDADDTLWHSESYFALSQDRFRALVSPWSTQEAIDRLLLEREQANLHLFGYGVKGFTLSMVETAIEVSEGAIPVAAIQEIIEWGKDMMRHPVELIDGVAETIKTLHGSLRLMLITKGDLLHQESKIAASGLADFFEHIEILSEKSPESYQRVLDTHGVSPSEFLMVGNSVRSDVLPLIEIGARAAHVPYELVWGHEEVDEPEAADAAKPYEQLSRLPDLLKLLAD